MQTSFFSFLEVHFSTDLTSAALSYGVVPILKGQQVIYLTIHGQS